MSLQNVSCPILILGCQAAECIELEIAAGVRLAPLPLAGLVSSPLERCRQTLAAALPAAVPVIDERLTECGYGDWTGQPLKNLLKDPLWRVVQAHPSAAVFPGNLGAIDGRTHQERILECVLQRCLCEENE